MLKRLVISTLTAAFAFAGMGLTALAAGPAGPPPAAAAAAPPVDEAPDAVTQHTITLDGKVYPYTARAGTIALSRRQGHADVPHVLHGVHARRRRYVDPAGDVLL